MSIPIEPAQLPVLFAKIRIFLFTSKLFVHYFIFVRHFVFLLCFVFRFCLLVSGKACDLATSKSDKSNIMLKIANLYYKQKNYQQVRTYAQKALSYNSNNGSAYLLIGNAYAASASTISTDAFIQRTAYWAAVDKFEKAKAVDSNCTGIANSLISSYKKYFPDKKECFMRKISGTFHVPGWINENTTVR